MILFQFNYKTIQLLHIRLAPIKFHSHSTVQCKFSSIILKNKNYEKTDKFSSNRLKLFISKSSQKTETKKSTAEHIQMIEVDEKKSSTSEINHYFRNILPMKAGEMSNKYVKTL